ncbi:hypothetical protein A9Q84_13040 [Halobacteriovorax marinus]|uniref:Uncharacterized protein n=1 Tax=Halobacteriovorax marinus TaxID=97084 RepID=A0A1Y5F903_9BACT|nr:hypothetical protein A9Q84_13040 [Halobacteriovorax marinus]
MKESLQEKTDNLVLFPSAKNYSVESSGAYDPTDPLEDLLNEFSHLPNEDDINLGFEDEEEEELDCQPAVKKLGQIDRILLIHRQLKDLEDTTLRIKYLIDEIDDFLPKRKRNK